MMLDVWKDYLSFHTVDFASRRSSRGRSRRRVAPLRHRALPRHRTARERWKRAVDLTNEALGDAAGAGKVARYFPPEPARGERMVANIIDAFRTRIDQLPGCRRPPARAGAGVFS
ncbi:MAG: hypothetical protein R2862_12070 [Thermoanaerobaculia bacterium]